VYRGVNEEHTAERQLQNLRQTGSTIEYISKFQQVSSRVEWDDVVLIATFYIKLKDHVKDKISCIKRLEELINMINTAIYINNQMYKRQLERTRGRTSFQPYYYINISKTKKASLELYSKEIDLDTTYHKKRTRPPHYKGLLKA
jgi:Retrotransposon gag protein